MGLQQYKTNNTAQDSLLRN